MDRVFEKKKKRLSSCLGGDVSFAYIAMSNIESPFGNGTLDKRLSIKSNAWIASQENTSYAVINQIHQSNSLVILKSRDGWKSRLLI